MTHPQTGVRADMPRTGVLAGMIVGHLVADGPMQPQALSLAKGHDWRAKLLHAAIHGGAVALATRSVTLGLAETAAHATIDHAKRSGHLTTRQDQTLHILCKIAWWLAMTPDGASDGGASRRPVARRGNERAGRWS
jgi:hypothetical protein